jgi:hypothetical protein
MRVDGHNLDEMLGARLCRIFEHSAAAPLPPTAALVRPSRPPPADAAWLVAARTGSAKPVLRSSDGLSARCPACRWTSRARHSVGRELIPPAIRCRSRSPWHNRPPWLTFR